MVFEKAEKEKLPNSLERRIVLFSKYSKYSLRD